MNTRKARGVLCRAVNFGLNSVSSPKNAGNAKSCRKVTERAFHALERRTFVDGPLALSSAGLALHGPAIVVSDDEAQLSTNSSPVVPATSGGTLPDTGAIDFVSLSEPATPSVRYALRATDDGAAAVNQSAADGGVIETWSLDNSGETAESAEDTVAVVGTGVLGALSQSQPVSASTKSMTPVGVGADGGSGDPDPLYFVGPDSALAADSFESANQSAATGPIGEFGATAQAATMSASSWSSADIGTVGTAGSTAITDGNFTVAGAGAGLGNSADAFRYVSTAVSGDVQIVAKLNTLQNVGSNTRAGVMFRVGTASNAVFASVTVSPNGTATFQSRTAAGGPSAAETLPNAGAPQWVKLTLVGTSVIGYVSSDGADWRRVGSRYITLSGSVRAGMAVASGSTTQTATASFSGVVVGAVSPSTPSPWMSRDIGGTVRRPGSATYYDGEFEVSGDGSAIGMKADNFQYTYRPFRGNGSITARVTSVENTDPVASAGVMIRQSLTAESSFAYINMRPAQADFTSRVATATSVSSTDLLPGQTPPYWVRLTRAGNVFTGFTSPDGQTWTQRGTVTIAMGSDVFAGLAVTSHNQDLTATATFDNVSVVSQLVEPQGTAEIGGAPATREGENYTLQLATRGAVATSWLVDWGDGTTSSLAGSATSASHVFPDGPQDYIVRATATTASGNLASNSISVRVDNSAPTVSLVGDLFLDEGAPYVIALGYTDPGGDTVQYWDINWGDGSPVQRVAGNPPTVERYYAPTVAGATVTATVTDEDGTYVAPSRSFTTVPTKPSGVTATATAPDSVRIDWINSSQIQTGFRVERSTDGVNFTEIGAVGAAVSTYTATGLLPYTQYYFRVRASGAQGFSVYSNVDVVTTPPRVSISGAAEVNEGSTYTLTLATGGTAGITGWRIDWGDGETQSVSSGVTSVSHVFADGPAKRTITASATTSGGSLPAGNVELRVNPVSPTVSISGPSTFTSGQPYTLTLNAAQVGADTISEWVIDWGDGLPTDTVAGSAVRVDHTFVGTGPYRVFAIAKDEDGTYRTNALSLQSAGANAPQFALAAPSTQFAATADVLNDVLVIEPSSLDGWQIVERGGSAANKGGVTVQAGNLVLREGDSFQVELRKAIDIPAGIRTLRFTYSQLSFDGRASSAIGDAFEVALVDSSGRSLVQTHAWDRDSFLNVTERVGTATGPTARVSASESVATGQVVDIDVSSLAETRPVLVLRLVNQDNVVNPLDRATTVTLVGSIVNQTAPPVVTSATVNPNPASEGGSVTFSATFTDTNPGDTHTAKIFWDDGTWTTGVVDQAAKTVTGTHVYADNGVYSPRVEVSDQTGRGVASATITVQNVAPTLAASVRFETKLVAGQRKVAAVLSGTFTDPGFTLASAGTAETFRIDVDWGDGQVERIDPTELIQGSDGRLTLGRISASHVYGAGGVYNARVTVTDDDGGQATAQFRFAAIIIQVVSQVNLKGNGEIPVKIFDGVGFNPSLIEASSLRFGPAGARAKQSSVSSNGKFAMTHYETQASGIRPTDREAYLTGTLTDGTFFVGMDSIRIVPGSQQGRNGVIPAGSAPKFFVADTGADNVYRYDSTGTNVGHYPLESTVTNAKGIASNSTGDILWAIDATTAQVSASGPTGTPRGSFLAGGVVAPVGITTDDVDLWVVDAST